MVSIYLEVDAILTRTFLSAVPHLDLGDNKNIAATPQWLG